MIMHKHVPSLVGKLIRVNWSSIRFYAEVTFEICAKTSFEVCVSHFLPNTDTLFLTENNRGNKNINNAKANVL